MALLLTECIASYYFHMVPQLPIKIRRSIFGRIAILLLGTLLSAGIFALGYWVGVQNRRDAVPVAVLQLMGVVVLFGTLVAAIVYELHTMTLDEHGITIKNWSGLFFSSETHCDWKEVEDLNVKRGGVFAFLGGYGSLLIQTAGTETNLRFNYLPRPEYWRQFIDQRS